MGSRKILYKENNEILKKFINEEEKKSILELSYMQAKKLLSSYKKLELKSLAKKEGIFVTQKDSINLNMNMFYTRKESGKFVIQFFTSQWFHSS